MLLLLSIFAAVIIFGISLFQRWMISRIDPLGGKHVVVYDSDGSHITRTDSFVGNEGPVRIYRVDTNEAAILGVRAETNGGFTTRQRLYFSDSINCTGSVRWILDPTTAAAAATQFLPWSMTPAGVAGYGHPVSDYYTLQAVAFAMGPNGLLYRAYGSESTSPPLTPGYDPTITNYPASEWASERYDAGRCRQLGPLTTDPGTATAEQIALVPYLMQVDNSYTIRDKDGIPYSPMFWSPTRINPVPPIPVIGSNQILTSPATPEGGTPFPPGVTTTGADGLVYTPPSGGEGTPAP
ncbi:MAG TPA: hypothetical protein VF701_08270 [Thermoanaerobaculia bacterium]